MKLFGFQLLRYRAWVRQNAECFSRGIDLGEETALAAFGRKLLDPTLTCTLTVRNHPSAGRYHVTARYLGPAEQEPTP